MELLNVLLTVDPSARWSIGDALCSEWVKNYARPTDLVGTPCAVQQHKQFAAATAAASVQRQLRLAQEKAADVITKAARAGARRRERALHRRVALSQPNIEIEYET